MKKLLILIIAALVLAGCGGGESETAAETTTPAPGDEVGSLALDPADGTLLIGSSHGTFRLPAGASEPEKLDVNLNAPGKGEGPLLDLVPRFSGPGEVFASGHSRGGTLPENVGMVRSADAGKTWEPVSGIGEIDYHDIEFADDAMLALRVDQPDVQVSRDGGKTFEPQAAPAAARAVDIAVNPGDAAQWAVGTEQGTWISNNSGGSWRQRDTTFGARVAWAAPDKLYSAGLDGKVRLSPDGGRSWNEVGTIGAGPKDFQAGPKGELYAYVAGGKVRSSTDGGATWNDLVTLQG
jgi:photosystem II stability/assembly factor-like uncharacterized protein